VRWRGGREDAQTFLRAPFVRDTPVIFQLVSYVRDQAWSEARAPHEVRLCLKHTEI
jgi:hypothetical protein